MLDASVCRTLTAYLLILHLITTSPNESQSIVKLSRVLSIGPKRIHTSQTVNIFVYSLDMIAVTVVTNANEVDQVVDKTTYHSRPIGKLRDRQYHELTIQYKYPYDHEKVKEQSAIRITLQIRACKRPRAECETETTEQLEHVIQVENMKQIYRIEVGRKTYGPGETVHFSLIGIPFDYLWGNVGETTSDYRGLEETRIDKITVHQSDSSVVCFWNELKFVGLLQLNCSIPLVTSSGTWTIDVYEKHSDSPTASQSFHVLELPYSTPTVQIVHSFWFPNSRNLTRLMLTVCANESDGNPIYGDMKVVVCPCHIDSVSLAHDRVFGKLSAASSRWIMRRESCFRQTSDGLSRPCAVSYAVAQPDGCGHFLLSAEYLNAIDRSNQEMYDNLLICLRVYDGIRASFYTKCFAYNGPITQSSTILYKYGLPTFAPVQLDPWRWGGQQLTGRLIEQQPRSCLAKTNRKQEPTRPRFHRLVHMDVDYTGRSSISVPPIFAHHDLKLKLERLEETSETVDHIEHIKLRALYTETKESMQLWRTGSEDKPQVDEDGKVQFRLIGNARLGEVTLHAIAFIERQWIKLNLVDYTDEMRKMDESCSPTSDTILGHYRCDEQSRDEIHCLDGWHGPGCLDAVCATSCSPNGGFCLTPDTCECHPYWFGNDCTKCMANSFTTDCFTGDECQCAWYNNSNKSEDRISLSISADQNVHRQQSKSPTVSARLLHYRTVQIQFDEKMSEDVPVILFYLTETSKDRLLEPIVTYVHIRHLHSSEKSLDRTKSILMESANDDDSAIQLTITPSVMKKQSYAICHTRVWDERMLLQENFGLQNELIHSLQSVISLKQNTLQSVTESSMHASLCEFEKGGISWGRRPGRTTDDRDMMCSSLEDSVCTDTTNPVNTNALGLESATWMLGSFVLEPQEVHAIGDKLGVQYKLNLTGQATGWRATAFCYGPQMGFWSSVSDVFHTKPPLKVVLTVPARVNLFELVIVDAKVIVNPVFTRSGCVKLAIDFQLNTVDMWLQFDAMRFSRCYCHTHNPIMLFQTRIMPIRDVATRVTIGAKVRIVEKSVICMDRFYSTFSQNDSSPTNIVAEHTANRIIRVSAVSTTTRHTGFVICLFKEFRTGSVQPATLNISPLLEGLDQRQDSVYKYLRLSGDLAALLWRYFEVRTDSEFRTGYDHLAAVAIGTGILDQFYSNLRSSDRAFEQLNTRTYRAVVRSLYALFGYRCRDSAYFDSLDVECDRIDYYFSQLVYRVFMMIMRSSHPWLQGKLRDEIFQFTSALYTQFNRLPRVYGGCLQIDPDSEEVNLAFTASITSSVLLMYPKDQLVEDGSDCLYRRTPDTYAAIGQYKSDSIAEIVQVLSWFHTDRDRIDRIGLLLEQRQITELDEGMNSLTIHWASDVNGDKSDVETTAYVYFALHQLGWPLLKLLPIIRWIVAENQLPSGGFDTSRDLLFGGLILLDYSNNIYTLEASIRQEDPYTYVPTQIDVSVPFADPKFHQRHQFFDWDRNMQKTIALDFDERQAQRINVQVHDFSMSSCVTGKLAIVHRYVHNASAETIGKLIMSSNCKEATYRLRVTERQLQDAAVIKVETQSGWKITCEQERKDFPKNVLSVHNEDGASVFIWLGRLEMRAEGTDEKTSILDLILRKVGTVDRVRPMRLTVTSWSRPTDAPTTYFGPLAFCEPQNVTALDSELHREIPRKDGRDLFDVCPIFVDPHRMGNLIELRKELMQLCNQTMLFIHLRSKLVPGRLTVRAFHITVREEAGSHAYPYLPSWETQLPPNAYKCAQFNRHDRFLVLNRAPHQIRVGERVLNLKSAAVDNEPITLLVLDNEHREFVQLLHTLTRTCLNWDVLVRVVYDSLH